MLLWVSIFLGIVSSALPPYVAKHPIPGMAVLLVIQIPWSIYDVLEKQWGFLIISVVGIPMYAASLIHHKKEKTGERRRQQADERKRDSAAAGDLIGHPVPAPHRVGLASLSHRPVSEVPCPRYRGVHRTKSGVL